MRPPTRGASAAEPTTTPDGLKGYPLIGNLPGLARDPLGFLTRCSQEHSDIVRLRFPGLPPAYLLSNPDHIEHVLVNNNRNFVKDRDTRHELRLLGNRLIASEGGFWRRQRRLMQPAFHRERVNAFGRVMVAYAERMLEGWADGQPRDVHEDLPRLRYAGMVVKESMRLYPPVWAIGREALDYCEIGGYGVSAGAQLFMSQWVVHRDGRHFENPEAFDPDRWANGLEKRLPKYAYFPFGGGPRLCIGNSFATMEATLLLATVARRFRLEVLPDHPVEPQPSITLRPKGGLPAVPRARR